MKIVVSSIERVPHGTLATVHLPLPETALDDDDLAPLHPDERAHAATLVPRRRATWVGGRVALRAALGAIGVAAPPILPDDRGAPGLPASVRGSISHKDDVAVALADHADLAAHLGVDVENETPRRADVARHVLTRAEADAVAALAEDARAVLLLLRFSMKEAIYKALDPFVRRYVAFGEVSVWPEADGTARVDPHLAGGEGPFAFDVRWNRAAGRVLATARVTRA